MAHATYKLGNITLPSVTEVMSKAGVSINYGRVPKKVLDAAAERGTAIHSAVADMIAGIKESSYRIPAEWEGYMVAAQRWIEKYKPRHEWIERSIISKQWRYGGTFDFYGKFGRNRVGLVDWKTRDIVRADGVQLAAYQHALAECEPERAEEIMRASKIGVGLSKDGKFKMVDFSQYEEDIEVFRAALIVVKFAKRWGRG